LWLLLRSKGIPEKIFQLLEDLYSNTFSCVRVDGEQTLLSPWFETASGVRQGCVVAPEIFLEPMDWIMNRAAYKGFLGVTVVEEICRTTDLDYADDVSLLASMLEILVPALEILHEESSQIGQEINWSKTKLQAFDYTSTPPSKVSVLDHDVEVVSSFVYLGSCTDVHGGVSLTSAEGSKRPAHARNRDTVTSGDLPSVCRPRFDFTMCTYSRYFFTELTRGV